MNQTIEREWTEPSIGERVAGLIAELDAYDFRPRLRGGIKREIGGRNVSIDIAVDPERTRTSLLDEQVRFSAHAVMHVADEISAVTRPIVLTGILGDHLIEILRIEAS